MKNRGSSKGYLGGVRPATELASSLEGATEEKSKSKEKEFVKPKRSISLAKLADL